MFKPNINITVKPKLSYQYHLSLGGEEAALVDKQLQLALKPLQACLGVELYHADDRIAQSIPFPGHGLRRAIQHSQLSTALLMWVQL